jgi:hypothetical protein
VSNWVCSEDAVTGAATFSFRAFEFAKSQNHPTLRNCHRCYIVEVPEDYKTVRVLVLWSLLEGPIKCITTADYCLLITGY